MRAVLIFPTLEKAPDRAYDCINGNSSLQTCTGRRDCNKKQLYAQQQEHLLNGIVCDCVVPSKKLGTPIHDPPDHRQDSLWNITPRFHTRLQFAVTHKRVLEHICLRNNYRNTVYSSATKVRSGNKVLTKASLNTKNKYQ